jgi:hypothetical protein
VGTCDSYGTDSSYDNVVRSGAETPSGKLSMAFETKLITLNRTEATRGVHRTVTILGNF